MDRTELAYWEARARDWRIAPPLAPGGDDIAWYESKAGEHAKSLAGRPLHALLLGVTPAIATMNWPDGTVLTAVDWSEGMIRQIWPRHGVPARAAAVRGDWRELPFAAASMDVAIGDGCYSALQGLGDAARLNREVHRVLRPRGLYCQRCFSRPERPMSVSQLFDDLFSGRIRNLDLFRWLLAMTVHGASAQGVSLREVWRVWNERVPAPAMLCERHGWTEEALANFEFWRQHGGRFSFPTATELIMLAQPCFDLIACNTPGYEMGEHFPRLLMRARDR